MTAAVTVWMGGRGRWLRSLAIALGLCVVVPLVFWGVLALFV